MFAFCLCAGKCVKYSARGKGGEVGEVGFPALGWQIFRYYCHVTSGGGFGTSTRQLKELKATIAPAKSLKRANFKARTGALIKQTQVAVARWISVATSCISLCRPAKCSQLNFMDKQWAGFGGIPHWLPRWLWVCRWTGDLLPLALSSFAQIEFPTIFAALALWRFAHKSVAKKKIENKTGWAGRKVSNNNGRKEYWVPAQWATKG